MDHTTQQREDDWRAHKMAVLKTLDDIGDDVDKVDKKVDKIRTEDLPKIRTDIALLKFQATLWGTLAGGAVTALFHWVLK